MSVSVIQLLNVIFFRVLTFFTWLNVHVRAQSGPSIPTVDGKTTNWDVTTYLQLFHLLKNSAAGISIY